MSQTFSKVALTLFILGCFGLPACTEGLGKAEKMRLTRCLSTNQWVFYSSFVCSACTLQKKAFGEAYAGIVEVECNPKAQNTQVDLCLAKNIRVTPTWIKEENGREVERIEGYHPLEDLAQLSGCLY